MAKKKVKSTARVAKKKKTPAAAKKKIAVTKTQAARKTPAKKRVVAAGPPKVPGSAELIVRQGFIIDATAHQQHAVPEVVVLANREGLQYLSEVFAHLADVAASRGTEADEPIHIPRLGHPVNARLSDAMEFRFAPITDANRTATFRRYGITMKSREHFSLFERYQGIAATDYKKVSRRLERDARTQKPDEHG